MTEDDIDKRAQRAATPRRQGYKPADLAACVGRILSGHVGLGWALGRSEILSLLRQLPAYRTVTDEKIRGAIGDLRAAGWLICNLMDDSGYFLAHTPEEYREFRALYMSYATTILARVKEMDQEASKRWGATALQERLF
jgi:hypothetical protein